MDKILEYFYKNLENKKKSKLKKLISIIAIALIIVVSAGVSFNLSCEDNDYNVSENNTTISSPAVIVEKNPGTINQTVVHGDQNNSTTIVIQNPVKKKSEPPKPKNKSFSLEGYKTNKLLDLLEKRYSNSSSNPDYKIKITPEKPYIKRSFGGVDKYISPSCLLKLEINGRVFILPGEQLPKFVFHNEKRMNDTLKHYIENIIDKNVMAIYDTIKKYM